MTTYRMIAEQREYNQMMGITEKEHINPIELRDQLSALINILISGVAVAVAIWLWRRYEVTHLRLLWSMMGAFGIMICEGMLYTLFTSKVQKESKANKISGLKGGTKSPEITTSEKKCE